MRVCSGSCGLEKPDSEFQSNRTDCRTCRSERDKARYAGLSSCHRMALRLERLYGLTIDDYEEIHEHQDGCCGICEAPEDERPLVVDHCHVTGVVRGLLCSQCNTAIGLLQGDSTTEHISAAKDWCSKTL